MEAKMFKKVLLIMFVVSCNMLLILPASANEGQPNFCPAIWADGETYGTKGTTALPAANINNIQSFDYIFIIVNSNNPAGQLPVAEAAPGNPYYNGGRWVTKRVEWTQAGFDAHGTVPVLTSYEDIILHEDLGHLTVTTAAPNGGPPAYFQCPLLPVKMDECF